MNQPITVSTNRPRVKIFSTPNYLTLSLIDNLLTNFCRVEVTNQDTKGWDKMTNYLKDNSFLSTNNYPVNTKDCDYVVAVYLNVVDVGEVKKILDGVSESGTKAVFVFPYSTNKSVARVINDCVGRIEDSRANALTVYVGDYYGPRMNFSGQSFDSIIQQVLFSAKIQVKNEDAYYPVLASEAAKEIVKLLFSFGPPDSRVVIYSEKISPNDLCDRLSKSIPGREFYLSFDKSERVQSKAYLINTPSRLDSSLKEVFGWFANNPVNIENRPAIKQEIQKPKTTYEIKPKAEFHFKFFRHIYLVVSLLVLAVLVPYLIAALSLLSLALGLKDVSRYETARAKYELIVSKSLSQTAQIVFDWYSVLPLIDKTMIGNSKALGVVKNVSEIGLKGIEISKQSGQLAQKIFGKETYSVKDYSGSLALSFDGLYRDTAFLESEILSVGGASGKLIKKATQNIDLAELRKNLLAAKLFSEKAPEILGQTKPVSYLIVFQNNMELRPTGGFIGSFALVGFDGGRISSLDVQDVYSADGQLKGHVEPPAPIKTYLGEGGWYLRDANWNPDFATSASRIEWFLEKEIDKSVDGVVGIDLAVAQELLRLTGPLILVDYNEQVNAENLYETTQSHVEDQFFPGSTKKASFLTALTRTLLDSIIEINKTKSLTLTKPLKKLLDEKHVQLYFHDRSIQREMSRLGYAGEVLMPDCSGNCQSDWLGLVDANLGVNKANYYIARSPTLNVSFMNENIAKELSIKYKNNANPTLGESGIYKNYLRILLPKESKIFRALEVSGETSSELSIDESTVDGRREVGVYFEVLPGQTKSVVLNWESQSDLDFLSGGEYRFYWRKQAGTLEDPVVVNYSLPENLRPAIWPQASLTEEGSYVYNTTLARDLFSRLSW